MRAKKIKQLRKAQDIVESKVLEGFLKDKKFDIQGIQNRLKLLNEKGIIIIDKDKLCQKN